MAFCRNCGAPLPEGKRFCAECGEPTGDSPAQSVPSAPEYPIRQAVQPEYPIEKAKPRKKPLYKRWWFWVLAVMAATSIYNRIGNLIDRADKGGKTEAVSVSAPAPSARLSQSPTESPEEAEEPDEMPPSEEMPTPSSEPAEASLAPTVIRPEVKDYLDAYEVFIDEYIAFLEKYENADSASAALMLTDYYRLMNRYNEFAEKLDAMDESDYTAAEWAYYLEVTGRVEMKLLKAAG